MNSYSEVVKKIVSCEGENKKHYIEDILYQEVLAKFPKIETATYGEVIEIWEWNCEQVFHEQMHEYGLAA